ncbi:MAG: hypothetical protein J3Q66DRAFT_339527 [Benniella sp.]|nr:MAG: hypothetical protein J3Q66DRAFT_339527 [Benniella sp.]
MTSAPADQMAMFLLWSRSLVPLFAVLMKRQGLAASLFCFRDTGTLIKPGPLELGIAPLSFVEKSIYRNIEPKTMIPNSMYSAASGVGSVLGSMNTSHTRYSLHGQS